jgi:hypothetical protein
MNAIYSSLKVICLRGNVKPEDTLGGPARFLHQTTFVLLDSSKPFHAST